MVGWRTYAAGPALPATIPESSTTWTFIQCHPEARIRRVVVGVAATRLRQYVRGQMYSAHARAWVALLLREQRPHDDLMNSIEILPLGYPQNFTVMPQYHV